MPETVDNVIAEFTKNARERVRVTLTTYGGHKLIDLRAFYQDTSTGEWRPGRGLALRRELLPDLKRAILAAEKAAKQEAAAQATEDAA